MTKKYIILFIVILIILIFYIIPISRSSFNDLYKKVDVKTVNSLKSFRKNYPLKKFKYDGKMWKYISVGKGKETILFLHGMAGAYDVWWQQIKDLQNRYHIISVTYPPIENLEGLSRGIVAVLSNERISRVNLIGSSLGGYLAQYMIYKYPHIVKRVILGNTFPPNTIIKKKLRLQTLIIPFMPGWLIMHIFRQNIIDDIYPASMNSQIVLSYLLEQSYDLMSRAQFVSRYYCVINSFKEADLKKLEIPVLIIEASNDPLVEKKLRVKLKKTYPAAIVHTFKDAGHFPYLNKPVEYTRLIKLFLSGKMKD